MRRIAVIIGILVILISILAALYIWQKPRLVSVSPEDGASNVRTNSSVSLTFSGPMDPESVNEHLEFIPETSGSYEWKENTFIFSPYQPWTNGIPVTVTLEAGSKSDGLIPFEISEDFDWAFSIGQPHLAYLYPADGSPNIYIYNPLNGESDQLTEFGGILDYQIHQQNHEVYFSQRSGQQGSRIYRMSLIEEDPAPELLIECSDAICQRVQVSPDGDYLAYERTAFVGETDPPYPQVWLMPISEDNKAGDLTHRKVAEDLHQTISPHWSPDGLLTYYDFEQEAFVTFDPQDGEGTIFPNQTAQEGDWHPSAESYVVPEIFFIDIGESGDASLEAYSSSNLMLHQFGEDVVVNLTNDDTLEDTAPRFSPDGDQLAFARKYLTVEQWTPGRQLWIMDYESREVTKLTDDPFYNHYDFVWNPSGDRLAFVRFNQTILTELPEIWVIDISTSHATQILAGGYAPQWIP